jgi:hypothetical protein
MTPASQQEREVVRNPSEVFPTGESSGPDPHAMEKAAEALRAVEVEAAEPDVSNLTTADIESINIDELRAVAKALDLPDRETITEQDELIAAIRRCL